ncbi:MAG: response regulator transcription factor [Bacteroidetes bacterium]|nr:response regulator transcription factor [Bacteroidota bacterium]
MLKVLIVEDNLLFAKELKNDLAKFGCEVLDIADNVKIAMQLFTTQNPELVFIDIKLNGDKDGIEFARYINKNRRVPFIYLTDFYGSEHKHFKAAMSTKPANFLPKGSFLPKQIWHFLETAMENFAMENDLFINGIDKSYFLQGQLFIKDKNAYKRILAHDIRYVEVADAYCKIYTTNKMYAPKITLEKLLQSLSSSFIVRNHQSFAVNINYVKEYIPSASKLILDTEKVLNVGRTYKDQILSHLNLVG